MSSPAVAFVFAVLSCLLIILAATPQPQHAAHAWDCAGHQLTAHVAKLVLQETDPKALAHYEGLAQYQRMHFRKTTSFTELACWPDDIKHFMPGQYNNWHEIDQCFAVNNTPCPAEPPHPNIANALAAARERILKPMQERPGKGKAGATTKEQQQSVFEEKAFWLGFIVHLVGDAHQPLHVCSHFSPRFPHGDYGGNDFLIFYPADTPGQLHGFHDTVGDLISWKWPKRPMAKYPSEAVDIHKMAEDLKAAIGSNITLLEKTDLEVSEWLREGLHTCSVDSYEGGKLPFNKTLTDAYVYKMRRILQRKIVLGGYRLANLLLSLYENSSTSIEA